MAAGLVFGVRALAQSESEPDWVSVLPYWSRLEPVPVAWLPRDGVDAFFEKAMAIGPELDQLAREQQPADAPTPDPETP